MDSVPSLLERIFIFLCSALVYFGMVQLADSFYVTDERGYIWWRVGLGVLILVVGIFSVSLGLTLLFS